MPKGQRRPESTHICITLPKALLTQIDERAAREGRNRSNWIVSTLTQAGSEQPDTQKDMRKANQICVRMDSELLREVDACCAITGVDISQASREFFKAFVEVVRRDGQITLPFVIVPRKTWEAMEAK